MNPGSIVRGEAGHREQARTATSSATVALVFRRARRQEAKLRSKIEKAHQRGDKHRAGQFMRHYLRSYDARLIALQEASRRMRPRPNLSDEQLVEAAASLNVWRSAHEPVTVSAQPKSLGRYRPVMVFGLRNKARQVLLRRALEPVVAAHPAQYALRGKGRKKACAAVTRALDEDFRWALTLDITDCYGSFDDKELGKHLPLPRKVTETIVVSKGLNLIPGHIGNAMGPLSLLMEAARGIPQGSVVSPMVAGMLLAPLLDVVPATARVVNYADNFLILTRTRREAILIRETLQAAAGRSPVGFLTLRSCGLRRIADGFEFLGYHFRRTAGTTRVQPTKGNVASLVLKCAELIGPRPDRPDDILGGMRRRAELRRYVRSWCAAFRPSSSAAFLGEVMLEWMNRPNDLKTAREQAWRRHAARQLDAWGHVIGGDGAGIA